MTTEHRIGNRILNLVVDIAYHHWLQGVRGTTLHDSQSGMWMFRGAILPRLQLTQDGMPLSEEIKLEAAAPRISTRRSSDPLRRAVGGSETLELA